MRLDLSGSSHCTVEYLMIYRNMHGLHVRKLRINKQKDVSRFLLSSTEVQIP